MKNNRLILSRFKAAFESGIAAIKHSQSQPKTDNQTDQPLPDATLQAVTKDFGRRYGITNEPQLDPSDALRSRIYREFRRGAMTLLEGRRIKSVMHMAIPKTSENIRLSETVQLRLEEDESVTISSGIKYYFSIRVLCNAWAWAGQFEVTHESKKRPFICLQQRHGSERLYQSLMGHRRPNGDRSSRTPSRPFFHAARR